MAASPRRLDEVEDRWPAHEAVKRRIGFVKYRPEVVDGLLVAALAEGCRAASQMRGRQQRTAPHRPQRALRTGDSFLEVRVVSPKPGHERCDQLTREPILRLIGVPGQPRTLRTRRGGGGPVTRSVAAHA